MKNWESETSQSSKPESQREEEKKNVIADIFCMYDMGVWKIIRLGI